jgi:adenosine deaminase
MMARQPVPEQPLDVFRAMPKIDLHRHLEGSLRLETMADIARQEDLPVPKDAAGLRPLVQMVAGEDFGFRNFLSKFQTLRLFFRSPEIIARVAREAVEDAAQDNLFYLELKFTPVALARSQNYALGDVMDWVCESTARASQDFHLPTRLIVSVNRHEPVALAEQVAALAAERTGRGIAGLDLAGNEAEFAADPFAAVFRQARSAGLKVTVHAGEWGGAANVRQAIESLDADRIGHGVRVLEDPEVCALARERAIPFEVCVTSNVQTGVVPGFSRHPLLEMLKAGLNAVIATDDPGISQITLGDEYRLARQELGLAPESLVECLMSAVQAAFLPEAEREALASRLQAALSHLQL